MDFARLLDGWHDFYLLVGTASATLVGLLFLALTLNVEILRRDEFGTTRIHARRAFSCFINLLVVSGVLLIPDQSHAGTGIPLAMIGGISLLITVRRMVLGHGTAQSEGIGEIVRHSGLILIGMLALVVLGICIWAGWDNALNWMPGVVLTLVSAASQGAWELLTVSRVAPGDG
jgi:hypothetical protein